MVDPVENTMYVGGFFDTVNERHSSFVKWDGSNMTYYNIPFVHSVHEAIAYESKLLININSLSYRLEDTGWRLMNNEAQLWDFYYPYLNGRLGLGMTVTDPGTFHEHFVIGYLENGIAKDSLDLDTAFGGDIYAPTQTVWYNNELFLADNFNPTNKPHFSEIMRFDGTHWKDVGGGINSGSFGWVNQLLV